jgi:3-mercaptopyruvate sulfurtransferase SseA
VKNSGLFNVKGEGEDIARIVVYCSDANCIASQALGQLLERNGYTHVLHFAGGLQEREQAGYPLAGEWVKQKEKERDDACAGYLRHLPKKGRV